MQRIALGARADWTEIAEAAGFRFHTQDGHPYWDEDTVYAFDPGEVEARIERPAAELHAMCREAAEAVVRSEELLERLAIPRAHWDLVAGSWAAGEPELYGRIDLAYDGEGPAKMLEYNADTPTTLYESGPFQGQWLEDQIAAGVLAPGTTQLNRLRAALAERLGEIFAPDTDVHFAAFEDATEDMATVETIAWAARDAGLGAHLVDVRRIGLTDQGQFADDEQRVIGALFKLYPWEDMLRDDFAAAIAGAGCRILEPAWKAVVSNKGILPVLWRLFEGHPNLLPAFFEDEVGSGSAAAGRAADALARGHVTKPLFSREGASLTISEGGRVVEAAEDRAYDEHPLIVQAYHPLPVFDGFRPVLGAWVVGRACAGLGLREDRSRITGNLSLFKPHYIQG